MNAAPPEPLPLHFLRVLAVQVRRERGPQAPDARRLLRLLKLHRHLTEQAGGPDGAFAEGLAASLLPAIRSAATKLRL
jgi:hypothetical protein